LEELLTIAVANLEEKFFSSKEPELAQATG
jgi:hypothetical protein